MSEHPALTTTVYLLIAAVFVLVALYWVLYTRRLKTRPGAGTEEGIAEATQKKEREGTTGLID